MGKLQSSLGCRQVGLSALLVAWALAGCSESTRAGRNAAPILQGDAGATTSAAGSREAGGAPALAGSGGAAQMAADEERPEGVNVASGADTTSPADNAGAAAIARDAGGKVVLTAVVMTVRPNGTLGIAAEWANGTGEPIFLRGCSSVEGWYLQGGEWIRYGAFAQCAAETKAVEVGPGETYVDVTGAVASPPNRGTNVWRLVGKYGVGCRREQLFSASECRETHEVTSVNHIAWTP